MYVPAPYREQRDEILHAAIRARTFGTLITASDAVIQTSHVPFVIASTGAAGFVLYSHLSRANPQWHECTPQAAAVATFLVDDAYISPSWYPSKAIDGKVVPTWNYMIVEARGVVEAVTDPAEILTIVEAVVTHQEAAQPLPWSMDDAPETYIDALARAIVGIRFTVHDVTGAWKLDQKKADADRSGAAAALRTNGAIAMADAIAQFC